MKMLAPIAVAGALLVGQATEAAVVLTTDPTGYSGPVLDLGAYATGNYNFTFGPVPIPGGITFTASPGDGVTWPTGGNSGMGSVIGQGGYGLGANGFFGGDAVYIGVDSGAGFAELTFDTLISSFGGFWNYAPGVGENPFIAAYDAIGNLLASFDLSVDAPISTPGGFNAFAFRGLVSDTADIKTIRFGGSYILLAGSPDGSVPVSPIPVPAALPLMLLALGGLGVVARRRRG
jgi:hypothetical protein